jgi:hypothetical protein
MCSGWFDTFSKQTEKEAAMRYLILVMMRALNVMDDVSNMEELYVLTSSTIKEVQLSDLWVTILAGFYEDEDL